MKTATQDCFRHESSGQCHGHSQVEGQSLRRGVRLRVMNNSVAIAAQSNQVLLAVAARSASRNDVMDVELLTPSTPLAAPAIAIEDFSTPPIVCFFVLSELMILVFVSQAAPLGIALTT
jgi:hypothetical protein